MRKLWLFDIDGTLIEMTDIHMDSYQLAYQIVTGKIVPKNLLVSKFGKTEKQIHIEIFQELGISDHTLINRLIEEYESNLTKVLESANINPLPGVKDCLEYLKENKQYLGIITGNPEAKGKIILEKAQLLSYFSIFGWGNNANSRDEIVRSAINQANEKRYQFSKVIIIGDTPTDIKAGKSINAFTVGIATGYYDKDRLKEADLVLNNLEQYKRLLKVLK